MAYETFYLSAAGDGSAPKDGTAAHAYDAADFNTAGNWTASDAEGDDKIGPGDTVIVLDDDGPIRATLTVQQSGLSGKPITIQGETGGAARIAADDVQASWTPGATGYYATQTSLPYSVVKDGALLANAPDYASLTTGEWFWDDATDRLYVYDDPADHTIEVGARTHAFNTGGKSYLVVDGLELTGAATKSGIFEFAAGTANSVIKNCHVRHGYYGIHSGTLVGDNNTVGPGNHIYDLYGFGVVLGYTGTPTGYLITGNEINNCGNPEGPQLWGADRPSGILTYLNALTVEHNTVHDCYATSLSLAGQHGGYFSGGPTLVRYNTFYNNQMYGFKWSDATGGVAYYNLCYGNLGGIGLVDSTVVSISNNVLYGNKIGLHVNEDAGTSTVTSLKNNLIANNVNDGSDGSNQIYVTGTSVITASNNNLIYSSLAPADLCYYQDVAKTWVEWKALGFDAAGVNADPLVTSATDFHLQAGSPCINAGVNVGLTVDFDGVPVSVPPEVGAFAYTDRTRYVLGP